MVEFLLLWGVFLLVVWGSFWMFLFGIFFPFVCWVFFVVGWLFLFFFPSLLLNSCLLSQAWPDRFESSPPACQSCWRAAVPKEPWLAWMEGRDRASSPLPGEGQRLKCQEGQTGACEHIERFGTHNSAQGHLHFQELPGDCCSSKPHSL